MAVNGDIFEFIAMWGKDEKYFSIIKRNYLIYRIVTFNIEVSCEAGGQVRSEFVIIERQEFRN